MLQGKTVVLGVTGSIAAYKIANLASMLIKQHCEVHVVMTKNATNFINPITFETITNNKCLVDTFDRNFQFHVAHVSLAQKADVMMIAPASANIIGKMANGIADDMLSTMALACSCPIIVAPAMNTHMYQNAIVQDNINKLKTFGFTIINPATGMLACRKEGIGKMPDENLLMEYMLKEIAYVKDLSGKKILITAGPTKEPIDPVRFITNHSSGKMGYAIAKVAMLRGAEVTLVTGPTSLTPPPFIKVVPVVSADDMYTSVIQLFDEQDIVIKAAAVADYKSKSISEDKIKKKDKDMVISLERTKDILAHLGTIKKPHQFICGFSMETKDMIENSKEKLYKKNIDMIVANNLKENGAGFNTDTNIVTIITKENEITLPIMLKEEVANEILTRILELQ